MGEAWSRVVASGIVDEPNPKCAEPPPLGLLEGIRLFNDGQYYECHHALEDIWRGEREPIRYLYQGILQIGVGFHHLRNRNYRGATLLLRNGIDKTRRYRPACMSVDTGRLSVEAQLCLDQLLELGPERLAEFDWALVPGIHFATETQN